MRTSLGELVPFSINWNGGVEKVITDFEKWARKHYSTWERPKKKEPRKTYHESLKQLGVVRLKDALGNWKAVRKYTEKALGNGLYGDDHAVWRKARLKAIKRVEEMFPIKRKY